jgi:hypothetical protein
MQWEFMGFIALAEDVEQYWILCIYLFIYLIVRLKPLSTSGYERIYPCFWEICCFPEDRGSSILRETSDSLQDCKTIGLQDITTQNTVSLQSLENSHLLNFTNS